MRVPRSSREAKFLSSRNLNHEVAAERIIDPQFLKILDTLLFFNSTLYHMRLLLLIPIFLLASCTATKPAPAGPASLDYPAEIAAYQQQLNEDYLDPAKTPLTPAQQEVFRERGGHDFYPTDESYRIVADFEVYPDPEEIELKTSTTRMSAYRVYGKATFMLEGKQQSLFIYQSEDLMSKVEYANYLFLPFRDATSGKETYGGGRYIDLRTPPDPTRLVIDFNKSYHPYCAYRYGFSCPIPPAANTLDAAVPAGIKNIDLE